MSRRTFIKWLHWLSFGLIAWFFLVEPDENSADPGGALSFHAGMGMVLGAITLIWFVLFVAKGLAGRPGPKLPGGARRVHPLSHKILHWSVVAMLATGGLAALTAPFAISAFGALPIGPGIGGKTLHGLAQDVHEIVFNALLAVIVLHAASHIARHVLLKDNALRIMVPKVLHRWL